MKKIRTILFLALISIFQNSNAIPALPYPIKITQPDGSEITIYLKGDEFFRYKTTLDGYLLAENENGVLCYAKKENGKIKSSGIKASEINKRGIIEKTLVKTFSKDTDLTALIRTAKASRIAKLPSDVSQVNSFPLTGSPKSLVILVNFSDVSFVTANSNQEFTNLLNQTNYSTNGGTGSAKDYFRDASNGTFDPQFIVVGPYTLPQTTAYYGANTNDEDANPRQMVIDACKLADDNGVNFADYDVDGDGIVDNVFIYYAGHNEAEGASANTVWPHRWSLSNLSTKFDGKSIYDYACTSELKNASGTVMCGIGTFCHEFGHVLGLPDYYATNNASHFTLKQWNIMDYGAYLNEGHTPPTYSAYDRFYLHWLVPIELKTAQNVTIEPLLTSNQAYLISQNGNHNLIGDNPNPTEFFILENRQKTGWDKYLPASGMLITRINYNATTWYNNSPNNDPNNMGVDIMEADGVGSSGSISGDTYPGSYNVTSYTPILRGGTVLSSKKLTYIESSGQNILFRFMGGKYTPNIQTKGSLSPFTTIQGTPSEVQQVKIFASSLIDSLRIKCLYNLHFEFQVDGDSKWYKQISISPVDSIIDTTIINIRYNPTAASINYSHVENFVFSSKSAESISLAASGISSRKVYITAPIAYDATEINSNSFIANWSIVPDNEKNASGYYLTAYSSTDGQSTITQGFDNGLTSSIDWEINASSVTTTPTYSGLKIPAIILEQNNDNIITEIYPEPVSSISVYLKSLGGSGGSLSIDGWNGNTWATISNIVVTPSLAETKQFSFGSNNYYKFRINYSKGTGSIAIDDFSATINKQIDYIYKNKWLTVNTDTLSNLAPGVDHFYKVKSSDKTYASGASTAILYENISDYSNIIKVTTSQDTDLKKLHVSMNKDGKIFAIVPQTGKTLYIYNTVGTLLKSVFCTKNVIDLSNLSKNQVYILKYESRRAKIAL